MSSALDIFSMERASVAQVASSEIGSELSEKIHTQNAPGLTLHPLHCRSSTLSKRCMVPHQRNIILETHSCDSMAVVADPADCRRRAVTGATQAGRHMALSGAGGRMG